MAGSLWYKHQTASQSMYYSMRSIAEKTFKMQPDLNDIFEGEFLYPLEIFRDSIPFSVLKPACNVLHVGFDKTYFDKGLSHPLIETAIVGKNGMVHCIDPDIRNVEALNDFAKTHNLSQLKAHQGAVWNQNKDLKFAFDNNWGPMSGTLSIPEQNEYSNRQLKKQVETIHAKKIDDIVPDLFGNQRLDFLAITVNGAEPQALEGALNTLENNPKLRISMALAFGHFSFKIRKELCNQLMTEGWNVIVANSLHDPWTSEEFLWCCIIREPIEFINLLGAKQVTWDQSMELASKESLLIKSRADQVRNYLNKKNVSHWKNSPTGLIEHLFLKVKKMSMNIFN